MVVSESKAKSIWSKVRAFCSACKAFAASLSVSKVDNSVFILPNKVVNSWCFVSCACLSNSRFSSSTFISDSILSISCFSKILL